MGNSLSQMFVTGGWVMWPLLTLSVVTWAIVLERAYVFLTLRPRLKKLTQGLTQSLNSVDVGTAKQLCRTQTPPLSELFLSAMDEKKTREQAERTTDRNRARMNGLLKKNLWILGTIGSSSPFIGLLGTVVGIVRAFHDMSEKGAGGFTVVAGGISEALIATAAGLIVAIIALLTYNIFVNAANGTATQLKMTLDELIDVTFEKRNAASH